MLQAITVTFVGINANGDGPWWRASCAAKTRRYEQADNLNPEQNAKAAAIELATELGWEGTWTGGVQKSGAYVFVQARDASSMFRVSAVAAEKKAKRA